MKCVNATIEMKASGKYFPVVLFTMLYKLVLSPRMKPLSDHSNASY